MRRSAVWLLVVTTSCGGRAAQAPEAAGGSSAAPSNDARAGAADLGASLAGEGPGAGTAGAGGAQPPALGQAGEGSEPGIVRSATRTCQDDRYCFGLDCYTPAVVGTESGVCVSGCASDADCRANEVCLSSNELEPGCYSRCESPADCYYGFDCFDFANQQSMLVCFPTPWASVWKRLRL